VQASGFGVKTAFLGTTGRAMCRVSHRRKHESARFLFLMMVMHLLFSPPHYPLKQLFNPQEKSHPDHTRKIAISGSPACSPEEKKSEKSFWRK
jgi:hypothetical protein